MDGLARTAARGRRAALAFALLALASGALAAQAHARMDESDRQRLRQDLRQQDRGGPERGRWSRQTDAGGEPRNDYPDRPRLSPEEREQLREQLRQRQQRGRR